MIVKQLMTLNIHSIIVEFDKSNKINVNNNNTWIYKTKEHHYEIQNNIIASIWDPTSR